MDELRGTALTREAAMARTMDLADDPGSVVEVPYDAFNADLECGGFAFVSDGGLEVYCFDGGWLSATADPSDAAGLRARIDEYWNECKHRNRVLTLDDVSDWHRAAIAALEAGVDSVGDLAPDERVGVTDIARGDYVFITLRRYARQPTREAALRALAAQDWLFETGEDGGVAYPCPVCGKPAHGRMWYFQTVCDACYRKAVCRHGRSITGRNTSMGGGFEALHLDDRSICHQVTEEHAVWIGDVECHMGEAKFGGVFIGVPDRGDDC